MSEAGNTFKYLHSHFLPFSMLNIKDDPLFFKFFSNLLAKLVPFIFLSSFFCPCAASFWIHAAICKNPKHEKCPVEVCPFWTTVLLCYYHNYIIIGDEAQK